MLTAAVTGLLAAGCRETGRVAPGSTAASTARSTAGSAPAAPAAAPDASPTAPRGGQPTLAARPAVAAGHARPSARPLPAPPATRAARATVPVLCWHQLRAWAPRDSSYDRQLLVCPPAAFTAQLDALQAAGYTTIGPDQYLAALRYGDRLPERPVLLSFDDSQGSQMAVALPELLRRRMTATFFLMTVVLDRPRWMSRDDVRRLAGAGMTIGAHTWDHHRADRYRGRDWEVQLVRPKAELERLTGQPVDHFAYPNGAWDGEDLAHLTAAGYRSAYQLDTDPVDRSHPELTLRRQLVDSGWTGRSLVQRLGRTA